MKTAITFNHINRINGVMPPVNKLILLYDEGAFYTGTYNGRFHTVGTFSVPQYWADCLPETGVREFFYALMPDDEPDNWTNNHRAT